MLGRFTIEQASFSALREGGLLGVGAELSGWDRGEADLMPLMEEFTEAANQQKAQDLCSRPQLVKPDHGRRVCRV